MPAQKHPLQHQDDQPGDEYAMRPEPEIIRPSYRGVDGLKAKMAIITGSDSGIERAAAIYYAREGADSVLFALMKSVMPRTPERVSRPRGVAACYSRSMSVPRRPGANEAQGSPARWAPSTSISPARDLPT